MQSLAESDVVTASWHPAGRRNIFKEMRKRSAVWSPLDTGIKNQSIASANHRGERLTSPTAVDALRALQRFGIFAGHDTICIVSRTVTPAESAVWRANKRVGM